MPRLKRSKKAATVAKVAPEMRPLPRATEMLVAALCPVCGRSIPQNRAIKIGHITVDRVSYFGSIDWDPLKPFGVKYMASGKGSFSEWQHIGPEEAPELFEAVKKRLIDAVHEWVEKGWIKEEEL